MVKPGSMLTRLAQRTRAHHATADAERLALMDVCSVEQYRAFLARIYGFEVAVEHAIANVKDIAMHRVVSRSRLDRLREDLVALGMDSYDVDALPRCATVSAAGPAQAFGALYVIERNTLVAGLVHRYLASQLPGALALAGGYLAESSRDAGPRFRAFGDALGVYVGTASADLLVAAAVDVLGQQHRWYSRRRRQPTLRHNESTSVRCEPAARSIQPRDAA